MSVVTVNEQFFEREGVQTIDSVTSVRVFHVITDTATDDDQTILGAPAIPDPFDDHPSNSNLEAQTISVKQLDESDRLNWRVVVNYRLKEGLRVTIDDSPIDPTDLPPVINFGFTQYNRVVDRAYTRFADQFSNGFFNPTIAIDDIERQLREEDVFNSAGQPFDPPLTQEEGNLLISIQRNEKTRDFTPGTLANFRNTLNRQDITIAGVLIFEFEGKMRDIGAQRKFESNGADYWAVNYEIEVDFKTHIRSILDQGFYTTADGGATLDPILDSEGSLVTEPKKLDGNGLELGAGADPVYRHYLTYFPADWETLDLPTEFTD